MPSGTDPNSTGPARPEGRAGAPPMRWAHLCWLVSAVLLAVYLVFEPYLSFALFGSDTGEYVRLTSVLASTGHIPQGLSYLGWGTGYPDFPGIFLLGAA